MNIYWLQRSTSPGPRWCLPGSRNHRRGLVSACTLSTCYTVEPLNKGHPGTTIVLYTVVLGHMTQKLCSDITVFLRQLHSTKQNISPHIINMKGLKKLRISVLYRQICLTLVTNTSVDVPSFFSQPLQISLRISKMLLANRDMFCINHHPLLGVDCIMC